MPARSPSGNRKRVRIGTVKPNPRLKRPESKTMYVGKVRIRATVFEDGGVYAFANQSR